MYQNKGNTLAKYKIYLLIGFVLSIITYFLTEFSDPHNIVLETISVIVIIANAAIIVISGTLPHLKNLVLAPFKILRGFGTLGFLIAIIAFCFLFPLTLLLCFFVPVIPLIYGMLCAKRAGN